MADKLSEAGWAGFKKKQGLTFDDAPLVKALSRLDHTREDDAAARVEAASALSEQLRKHVVLLARQSKALGDKLFKLAKDELNELLELSEKAERDARAQAADAEEEPALLTTGLTALIRELRKGELTLPTLIAVGGKDASVLVSRHDIAPSRSKLLKEYLEEASGAHMVPGHVLFEDQVMTFVVQATAAGMAKKIRAALLKQTGLRLRVRIRGEDGQTEEDGEHEEPAIEAGTGIPPAPPGRPAPAATPARPAAPSADTSPASPSGTAAPAPASPPATAPAASPSLQPAAGVAPGVAFTQLRLIWDQTRKKVQAELQRLEQAILEQSQGEPDAAEIAAGTRNLYTMLAVLDERLADKLDEALNAADPAVRQALHDEARAITEEYVDFVENEDLLLDIDDNGFVPVAVHSTLVASLKLIGARLHA